MRRDTVMNGSHIVDSIPTLSGAYRCACAQVLCVHNSNSDRPYEVDVERTDCSRGRERRINIRRTIITGNQKSVP